MMKTVKYLMLINFTVQAVVFALPQTQPQNIILVIVDGAGINHIIAADYYHNGKKKSNPFEKFPVKLSVSTYPAGGSYEPARAVRESDYVKQGYTDSAAAATALATGVKTVNGSIGIDSNGNRLENIIEKCEKMGMSTGVVTTVPFSHATPAAFVAHINARDSYSDIANQMINESALEVIFGCGNPLYDNDGKKILPGDMKYVGGIQIWNALIDGKAGADADGDGVPDKWTLIQSRQDFVGLANGYVPKRVIGICQTAETLQQKRSGISYVPFDVPLNPNVPNLSEMSRAAINVLDDNPRGFFVMIEAGAVDWASHNNQSARVIEEMIDLYDAVNALINWVETKSSWKNTLLIITADHQTGYLTGPAGRSIVNKGRGKMPELEWHSKNHINTPVFLFAKGKGSELLSKQKKGNDPVYGKYIDNTDIPKTIIALLESAASQQK